MGDYTARKVNRTLYKKRKFVEFANEKRDVVQKPGLEFDKKTGRLIR